MVAYTNFYETLKEARMRLINTVVLYEGRPYYILDISDRFPDGIFRVYLDDLLHKDGPACQRDSDTSLASQWHDEPGMTRAEKLDKIIEKKGADFGLIRKMMNSPHFNKFRPFPLGMVNSGGKVFYTERQPTRSTQQGLSQQMLLSTRVTTMDPSTARALGGSSLLGRGSVGLLSRDLANTIVGDYPSVKECIAALSDPRVGNEGAAFARNFALFRGPLDVMYLAYKSDIVGILPDGDTTKVVLGRNFKHCKEVVSDLGIFDTVRTKD